MNDATTNLATEERPGLIAGRYVLGELFASGGTGTVHLGRIVGAGGFSRVVAIKRLFPAIAGHRGFREMLLEEARLVSRIRHPNVVPAIDVVEDRRDVYIVMEYVHGPSLALLLTRAMASGEPIPLEIAIGMIEAVLLGLHAAHEARSEEGTSLGIVHRDVSPQNILVGADGVTRLIDFGIAKATTRIEVTAPGIVKGKLGYMPPEQFLYQSVSRLSDVYAVSVVLWEALANQRLFEGRAKQLKRESSDTSVRRAIETKVLPPSSCRRGIEGALDAVVMRGLELEPAERFPTAEAMAIALRRSHSVALPVDIARWLERFAPDELEIAEERVRFLEQAPRPGDSQAAVTPSIQLDLSMATSSREDARGRRRARVFGLGAIALGAMLVALVIAAMTGKPAQVAATQSPAAAVAAGHVDEQIPSKHISEPPFPDLAPPAASPAASSRRARKPGKSSCDPPYTIDANGHKHYNPDCF